MARILVQGPWATVELTRDPEEDQVIATCVDHSLSDGRLFPAGNCDWTATCDDMGDATEYSSDHADTGSRR
jgi:hypothetical protein